MSYLVFARKWRPRDFDEVVGQEHVTRTLRNALLSGKIAHAYLFAGPQGVGKTSCARILAKSMNCEKGMTDKPCGACAVCREITEGRSLDVIEIDGASNRGIDEIRTLRENVKFSPLSGRTKIYIIDEVHMLTPEAFNALLKTLEEPPPYVKFIFATTRPEKVLPTILSRCQRFDFIRIPNLKIVEKLQEICRDEKIKIDDDVLFSVARASGGSLRDAESILDQLISFSQKDIKMGDVVLVLGIIEQEVFAQFVDQMVSRDAAAALELISSAMANGKDMGYFLEGLLEYYRNLMVAKVVKVDVAALMDLPKEALAKTSEQANQMTLNDILMSINHILVAQELAKKLNSGRIPLEILAVRLSQLGAGMKKPNLVIPAPAPAQEKSPHAPRKEEKSCSLQEVVDSWEKIIEDLGRIKMSLATYLRQATPVLLENNTLTVGFPKESVFFKETMGHKDNLKIFENTLKALFDVSLQVKLEIVEGLSSEKDELPAPEEDPFFKSTLDLFKGKVIKKA
jgi:DNA polymerase-3 subunit gamma/tau